MYLERYITPEINVNTEANPGNNSGRRIVENEREKERERENGSGVAGGGIID